MEKIVFKSKSFANKHHKIFRVTYNFVVLFVLGALGYYLNAYTNYLVLLMVVLVIILLVINRGDWPVKYIEFDDAQKSLSIRYLRNFFIDDIDCIKYINLEFYVGYNKIQSSYKNYGYIVIVDNSRKGLLGNKKYYTVRRGNFGLFTFNEAILKLLEVSVNNDSFKSKVRKQLSK